MGRKRKEIDPEKIHELSSQGLTQKEMAKELGVSHVTLAAGWLTKGHYKHSS